MPPKSFLRWEPSLTHECSSKLCMLQSLICIHYYCCWLGWDRGCFIIKMNSLLLWTRLRWRWLKPECNTETCPSMPTLRWQAYPIVIFCHFSVHNWQIFADGNYHHRSGKNVWPRFSSFPGNSDTQGDPVIILWISMKFANIVLAQGQPCLQEGPHRVSWEEAGHE